MWLYAAVALAILTAVTAPLIAGARVVALNLSHPRGTERADEHDHPELRALIDRYR